MFNELRDNYQRLQGKIAPLPSVQPAGTEQSQRSALENINRLPELREWLKQRLRWVRDWYKAPGQLTPAFRDAIIATFRPISVHNYPGDPAEVEQWALERVWLFSVLTIHHAHDWLETHDVFGAPEWRTPDLTKDEYAGNTPVEVDHLSALLNFVGVRAAGQNPPHTRGRKKRYDPQKDREVAEEWRGAHAAGVEKKDFAKDKGMTVKEFDRLLNRVRRPKKKQPEAQRGRNVKPLN